MTEHRFSLSKLAESLKDGDHSIFSASGSGLWMHCAGGLLANLLLPDNSGEEAAEGTVAHSVGELWLRTRRKPLHLVGSWQTVKNGGVTYRIKITIEMLGYVEEYFDWCSWQPGDHYVETKVYYSQLTPIDKQGGTADHVACSYQRMCITDLKYGKGVPVFAEGNTQALLYALGFFYEWDWLYDFQEIEMRICQPRLHIFDSWTITREQLLAFAEIVRKAAHAAWRLDAPRTPGLKQCTFCRAAPTCTAHIFWQDKLTRADDGVWDGIIAPVTIEDSQAIKAKIEALDLAKFVEPHTLTTAHMAALYAYRSRFESWWKSLHNELNIRAANGDDIPGMKLVEGRSNRVLRKEETVLAILEIDYGITREELIKETMPSPTELEKILRAKGVRPKDLEYALDPMVRKPRGKPTLVSLADRRAPIVDFTEIAFADLNLETTNPETEDSSWPT